MKISKSCYAITGLSAETPWTVNSGFVVGDHSTLIIDTGSNYLSAQTIFGYSTGINQDNKSLVINTEPHFDHIGGNSFFRERGIDIFAHPGIRRTEEIFNQNKEEFNRTIQNSVRRAANEAEAFFYNTLLANPNKCVIQGDIISLGGIEAKIFETPGHTPFNVSIFIEPESILYCGDCVVSEYLPNLEAGDQQDWSNWLQALGTIENLDPVALVPGHGHIIVGKSNIKVELKRMRRILNTAIKESKAPTLSHIKGNEP